VPASPSSPLTGLPQPAKIRLGLRVTPQGHLLLDEAADEAPFIGDGAAEGIARAWARGSGYGLLQLGASEVGSRLPPVFAWWREFAGRYVAAVCLRSESLAEPGQAVLPTVPSPTAADLASLLLTVPLMPGAEYLSAEVLLALWSELETAFVADYQAAGTDPQTFLKRLNPAWNVVGRVHFHLAENKNDANLPFAFMATYAARLSAGGKAVHMPLGQALREYAGPENHERLLSLLVPVQRAAEACEWLRETVDAGEIFHPLRWSPRDASRFLASVPALEHAGLLVRMPPTWRAQRPARPRVTATVGARKPSGFGLETLLDFRMEVTLEDEPLTPEEIRNLLSGTETLVLLRGQWVEIDRERLERAMREFSKAQALAERNGLTFAEAMRMLSGAAITESAAESDGAEWSRVTVGPWLAETLQALRTADGADIDLGSAFRGTLRPYQRAGVEWMRLLSGLGLGACLADDMGLGKTVQVLSLLLLRKKEEREAGAIDPSLLVVPASLLANWASEIKRFTPGLRAKIAHPSAMSTEELKEITPDAFTGCDLVITSYGTLLRMPVFAESAWRLVILDEAQAIKNHQAKQTKAAKALRSQARIAMTGTPVENHLGDLWSIFDFINPGLLGTSKQFSDYAKSLAEREENPYGPLRELVRPYILRRMKTDKAVITDLPDKTELKAYCQLTRKQTALYAQAVDDLQAALASADDFDGIKRKGLVLSTLMRLKQICNHPSQWLNDNEWAEEESGKFARLREIATVVGEKQEKMLVFTQFREVTGPLEAFLSGVFGRPGLVLHGGTAVKHRSELVRAFQEDESIPFFILSLKAGGSGLTLTAASHVVHFDRWWNPAVENQATDRAFRIGQRKNVLVHKFVCRGTVEEKIDTMIEEKKRISEDLLSGSGEVNVTELNDDELLRLVSLDLTTAMKE
jgi:superfamily II DNA or RNA helicase